MLRHSPQDTLRYLGVNLPARDNVGVRRGTREVGELRTGGLGAERPIHKGWQKQILQPTSINEGFVSSIFELCPLSII